MEKFVDFFDLSHLYVSENNLKKMLISNLNEIYTSTIDSMYILTNV